MQSLPAAILMLLVAGYCAARLLLSRLTGSTTDHFSDLSHLAMAVAMAGMLAPQLALPVPAMSWGAVFLFLLVASTAAVVRPRWSSRKGSAAVHVQHVVGNAAMLVMVTAAGAGDMGMSMAGPPMDDAMTPTPLGGNGLVLLLLEEVLAVTLVLVAARAGASVVAGSHRFREAAAGRGWVAATLSPLWPSCCEAAMTTVMAAALFAAIF